jgi:hypothetical protein
MENNHGLAGNYPCSVVPYNYVNITGIQLYMSYPSWNSYEPWPSSFGSGSSPWVNGFDLPDPTPPCYFAVGYNSSQVTLWQ